MGSKRRLGWYDRNKCGLSTGCLLLIIAGSVLLLLILRYAMRPVAIADIACIFVKNAVCADLGRSPVELVDNERSHF